MKCPRCDREGCKPVYFRLCPECGGAGCTLCAPSLVPGILPDAEDPEGGQIIVCSEWADPEIDAAIDNQRPSLLRCLITARDALRKENS